MPHIKSYLKGKSSPLLKYQTIGECFDSICEQYPDREAMVVSHQGIRKTYGQYQQDINKLAKGLMHLGVGIGDRVGLWSPNNYAWVLTQMACAKIGAIMVCINPAYRKHELEYALNKVRCQTLIVAEQFKSSDYLNMLQTLAPELAHCEPGQLKARALPHLNTVISLADHTTPGMFNFAAVKQLAAPLNERHLHQRQQQLHHHDAINIQFTSGTTGSPKGATLTHFNILNNAYQVAAGIQLTEQDRVCVPVPLYHCFGMVMGHLACITQGATTVLPGDAFEPLRCLQTLEQEQCTGLYGVPTMFIAQLEHPQFKAFKLNSLRTGIMAGAPCPPEVMKRVINDMHMKDITIMYGQTETSPVNHMTAIGDPLDKQVGTVGRCAPHLEVKLINEQGDIVAVGARG